MLFLYHFLEAQMQEKYNIWLSSLVIMLLEQMLAMSLKKDCVMFFIFITSLIHFMLIIKHFVELFVLCKKKNKLEISLAVLQLNHNNSKTKNKLVDDK